LLLLVAQHPDDPDHRVLAHVKNNAEPKGPSLTYRLVSTETGPRVGWDGPTNLTAGDLYRTNADSGGASKLAEK
jgi:hypothetical protein